MLWKTLLKSFELMKVHAYVSNEIILFNARVIHTSPPNTFQYDCVDAGLFIVERFSEFLIQLFGDFNARSIKFALNFELN